MSVRKLFLFETVMAVVILCFMVLSFKTLRPWFHVISFSPPFSITSSSEPHVRAFFSFADMALKIVGFIAVLVGFLFTFHQVKASTDRVRITAVLDRMAKLSDPAVVKARRRLYEIYCDDPHQFESIKSRYDTGPELRRWSELTIRTIGEIGILLHQDFIDNTFIIERMPLFPARMWIILSRYIEVRDPQDPNNELAFAYVAYVSLTYWCRLNIDNHDASLQIDGSIPSTSRRIPAVRVEGMRRELSRRLRAAGWTCSFRRDRVWGHSQNIVAGTIMKGVGKDRKPVDGACVVVEAETEIGRWQSRVDLCAETDSGGVFYVGVERGSISWFRLRIEKEGFRNLWTRPVRNDADNCMVSVDYVMISNI